MTAKHRILTFIKLTIAMISTTLGDIFLAQAVRELPPIQLTGLSEFGGLLLSIICLGKFWLALSLMAVFFFLWMNILATEELSYVLPMTAMTYIINAFLVGPILHESVSPLRWVGTVIIGAGVAIVSLSSASPSEENKATG